MSKYQLLLEAWHFYRVHDHTEHPCSVYCSLQRRSIGTWKESKLKKPTRSGRGAMRQLNYILVSTTSANHYLGMGSDHGTRSATRRHRRWQWVAGVMKTCAVAQVDHRRAELPRGGLIRRQSDVATGGGGSIRSPSYGSGGWPCGANWLKWYA
jgi:hypothetical protein